MSISEAIARVRRGATRSRASLLDGALSYLGVRLKTDLASRLKSDSVPPQLRPLATRLASLIKLSDPPPFDDSAVRQLEVVSRDRELARAAQRTESLQPASAPVVHAAPVAHAAGDVCPFTGLRADGSLADAPAAPVERAVPASQPVSTEAPAGSLRVDDLAGTTRLPIPTAANDASSVVSTAIASGADLGAHARPGAADKASAQSGSRADPRASQSGSRRDPPASTPKKPAAKRAPAQPGAKPTGEKRKEKLAAPDDLTNTSARSATRPAAKQSSGKGQTSSRKRRDSGL
jgi:hypothetical protein